MSEKLIYSKIARYPVPIPTGVDIDLTADKITVKSSGKQLQVQQSHFVKVEQKENELHFTPIDRSKKANAMSGTICALVKNVMKGVTVGFEKNLKLIGVGYRAQAQGKKLNLTLGFSHPVIYDVPEGITIETPSQTEITVKGMDKQLVGQVAAEIRAYRPPEPYKGKGVRYVDEHVAIKESSKKT